MSGEAVRVTSASELLEALQGAAKVVEVVDELRDLPTLRLARGQTLRGTSRRARLHFARGADGVALAGDNVLEHLAIAAAPRRRAVFLASTAAEPVSGCIALRDLIVTGQIECLLAEQDDLRHLELVRIDVAAADVVDRLERPSGNGVACLQGAVAIWNRTTVSRELTLRVDAVRIGAPGVPVRGGGLFVAGFADGAGGQVRAESVQVQAVYCDSGLGASDRSTICGGVFILPGVRVERVECDGPQVSLGANAVPIDNWGDVVNWLVNGPVTTHGPNAVAIVNAGRLGTLDVRGKVETFADGARACAVYGPAEHIRLADVRTRGAGATGIHIVSRVGHLEVNGLLDVRGVAGIGMVKGRLERLQADGVHIEAGGCVDRLAVPNVRLADPEGQPVRVDAAA